MSSSEFVIVDDAWRSLLRDCIKQEPRESRDGVAREVIGTHIVLDASYTQFLLNQRRALSPVYASAELLWYLSGTRNADLPRAYAHQYAKFVDKDGDAHGAYGYRLLNHYGNLFAVAKEIFIKSPASRQVVLPIFYGEDLHMAVHENCPDIPCTCLMQFLVRDERLHMMVYMRSNDLWLGFPYDVYCFTTMQKMFAGDLGIEAGEYHHFSGSTHLYERNITAAREALQCANCMLPMNCYDHRSSYSITNDDLERALGLEQGLRTGQRWPTQVIPALPDPLHDAVLCCASKFTDIDKNELRSYTLRIATTTLQEQKE